MKLPPLPKLPEHLLVREYREEDRDACLAIYHSNLPEFLPDAIELFESHLSEPFSYYLVVESACRIIACGGFDMKGDSNMAWFTFGMVRRELHRLGLGTLLVLARLALLDGEHNPALVTLETTLAMESFYQQFGFTRLSHPQQRYPGGSYYVGLGLSLPVEERDAIRRHLATLPVDIHVDFRDCQGG